MNIRRASVTLLQWCPVSAIIAGPEALSPRFEFLRQVNPPKCYAVPSDLPVLQSLGKLRPLGASEVKGLDSHKGTEHIWRQLDPLYPLQVVPQLGISITRQDVQFSKPEVRVYVHPFGYLATFRTQLTVPADSTGVSGRTLARIINNIERNPTLKIASKAFCGATRLSVLFERLFGCVSRQMFSSPVRAVSQDEPFFCLDLTGNDLPGDAEGLQNSRETVIELASALNRHTGNLPTEEYDISKLGTVEVGREAKSGPPSGWSFAARSGFATYIKPGVDLQHAQRAAGCHHRNVAKQVGFFRLYHGLLKAVDDERLRTAAAPVLQAALDTYDLQAIAFSKWWARWGTAVLHLDAPVRRVEEAYGLDRRYAHDRNAKWLGGGSAPAERRSRVFISYSHDNRKWFDRLRKHLKPIEDKLKDCPVWADDHIKAGQRWRDEIATAMKDADIAILLLSADFFASEFVKGTELPVLLAKEEAGRMTILTLVISAFAEVSGTYAERVREFQGVNSVKRSLLRMRLAEREETFVSLAVRVAKLLESPATVETQATDKSNE